MILQSIILIKEVSENIIPRYDRPFYHNKETLEICYHVDSVRELRVSARNILVQNVVCYYWYILLVLWRVSCSSVALLEIFVIIFYYNFIIIRDFPG